jgi:hypothetical protein
VLTGKLTERAEKLGRFTLSALGIGKALMGAQNFPCKTISL